MLVYDVHLVPREIAGKQHLSSYAESLSSEAKLLYQEKISVVNGVDPFCRCVGEPVDDVLPVDASDLVLLVLQTSSLRHSLKLTNLSKHTISLCVAGSRTFVHGEWQENMSQVEE